MTLYIAVYLAAVILAGFILPPIDKHRAEKSEWRIPEKTLFIVAFLGGALAMYISMRIFHHKTLHKRFMIGLPVIFILHIIAAAVFIYALYRVSLT